MMKTNTIKSSVLVKLALAATTLTALSACTSVPYRCPLEAGDKETKTTACAGMHESLSAAKKGQGGKQSVHLDAKGRIIPTEMLQKRPLQVLVDEPAAEPSGTPQYKQPKVFQVWTPGYVDGAGNLHDGRNSYFATKGEWRYGSLDGSGARGGDVAEDLMRPSRQADLPEGRIITEAEAKAKKQVLKPGSTAPAQAAAAPSDKVVLQNLSDSAQRAADSQKAAASTQAAPGVTAPSLKFAD